MNKKLTDITLILDKSGSMGSIREDAIGGVNTFIDEQKKVKGEAKFTLVLFDTEITTRHIGTDIQDVKPLTEEDYVPSGMTALLDAIGTGINRAGERFKAMGEDERPYKVLFVIMTDGHENSSREFDHRKIAEMIKHQEKKYSWEFIFLGADIDAIASASALGISAHKAYGMSRGRMRTAMRAVSDGTKAYRGASGQTLGTCDFISKEDQEKLLGGNLKKGSRPS